ncbi:MAG: ABC transporter substrate-binding protein [Oscillospiraceae bacterium]|nr:ABC transporter substrate-binding protein [Oscillospiraceae bacterium]
MKNIKRLIALAMVAAMIVTMAAGCGTQPTSSSEPASTPSSEPASTPAPEVTDFSGETPRNETFYLAGWIFQKPNDFNPMSANSANSFATHSDTSPQIMWECLFAYNFLDGSLQPKLATEYTWNEDQTVMTVKLNPAAHWNDGTPFTADDVVYTFDTHVKYSTADGLNYAQYIENFEKVDDNTVKINAKLDANGQSINPLCVMEYLPRIYMMQKAYLEKVEADCAGDAEKIKTAVFEDAPTTAPYWVVFYSDQKHVLMRDDNYWGQDASMYGSLPTPKYVVTNIYKDNEAKAVALKAGEIDEVELYYANVQTLWEDDGLPIATYDSEPPYGVATQMPTLWFNLNKPGLDNVNVRKAIAWAIDYDKILSNAMTNQAPSFRDYPRSILNPTPGERALLDEAAIKDVAYEGNDIEGAKKLLDDAGIVDTDGDGIRELNGQNLSFKAECPNGWSDWQAAIEMVAEAGKNIGIDIQTYYPERAVQVQDYSTGTFDIIMQYSASAAISSPWKRGMSLMSSTYNDLSTNLMGNYGHYSNARVDEILALIPHETDQAKLKEYYTELSRIYLEDVPSLSLMYRPQSWFIVNEQVWTGFQQQGDGDNIPPDLSAGFDAFWNLELVNP